MFVSWSCIRKGGVSREYNLLKPPSSFFFFCFFVVVFFYWPFGGGSFVAFLLCALEVTYVRLFCCSSLFLLCFVIVTFPGYLHLYSLQKHAYSNILKILPPKTENFQIKILIIFVFLLKTWIVGTRENCLVHKGWGRGISTMFCKKFCHWVRITSVLRFIKHIFITKLQSIPLLLKHIFVTFLPSREKPINSFLVSVGDTDK